MPSQNGVKVQELTEIETLPNGDMPVGFENITALAILPTDQKRTTWGKVRDWIVKAVFAHATFQMLVNQVNDIRNNFNNYLGPVLTKFKASTLPTALGQYFVKINQAGGIEYEAYKAPIIPEETANAADNTGDVEFTLSGLYKRTIKGFVKSIDSLIAGDAANAFKKGTDGKWRVDLPTIPAETANAADNTGDVEFTLSGLYKRTIKGFVKSIDSLIAGDAANAFKKGTDGKWRVDLPTPTGTGGDTGIEFAAQITFNPDNTQDITNADLLPAFRRTPSEVVNGFRIGVFKSTLAATDLSRSGLVRSVSTQFVYHGTMLLFEYVNNAVTAMYLLKHDVDIFSRINEVENKLDLFSMNVIPLWTINTNYKAGQVVRDKNDKILLVTVNHNTAVLDPANFRYLSVETNTGGTTVAETPNQLIDTETVKWMTGATNLPNNRQLQANVDIKNLILEQRIQNYNGVEVSGNDLFVDTSGRLKVPITTFKNSATVNFTVNQFANTKERVVTAEVVGGSGTGPAATNKKLIFKGIPNSPITNILINQEKGNATVSYDMASKAIRINAAGELTKYIKIRSDVTILDAANNVKVILEFPNFTGIDKNGNVGSDVFWNLPRPKITNATAGDNPTDTDPYEWKSEASNQIRTHKIVESGVTKWVYTFIGMDDFETYDITFDLGE
jgi:hypothetical protein